MGRNRIRHRIVDSPKFDRVHAKLHRQFIHGGFKRVNIRKLRGCAHVAWRVAISMDNENFAPHIRYCIHATCRFSATVEIGVRARRKLPSLMNQRSKFAIVACAQPNAMLGLGSIAGDCEALVPAYLEPYRPLEAACDQRDQRTGIGVGEWVSSGPL